VILIGASVTKVAQEDGAVKNFKELSVKAKQTVFLCFFLGLCIFATIVVICFKALSAGWVDKSIFSSIILSVLILVAFAVTLLLQYYFYQKRKWDYFIGLTVSITTSKKRSKI